MLLFFGASLNDFNNRMHLILRLFKAKRDHGKKERRSNEATTRRDYNAIQSFPSHFVCNAVHLTAIKCVHITSKPFEEYETKIMFLGLWKKCHAHVPHTHTHTFHTIIIIRSYYL